MLRINHGLQYLADVARRRRALFSILLLAPVLALLIGFFILPVAQLINLSTYAQQPSLQNPSPPHSLAHYANILGDPFYLQTAANSILLGFWTTLATLVISYPVAFYITRISGWERTLISVACLLPLFVNVIVGILGWYILLLPYGVIQQMLSSLNLMTGSLQLLRTFPALIAVLTYEHIPFAVLILVSSLQAIPPDKLNAARLLGAGVPQIFLTIVLPLTMPGLVASAILVFSLSASSYFDSDPNRRPAHSRPALVDLQLRHGAPELAPGGRAGVHPPRARRRDHLILFAADEPPLQTRTVGDGVICWA